MDVQFDFVSGRKLWPRIGTWAVTYILGLGMTGYARIEGHGWIDVEGQG